MKRLAGWVVPVAFGLVACGYIPGSASDPNVTPVAIATAAPLVCTGPADHQTCTAPATGTVSSAGDRPPVDSSPVMPTPTLAAPGPVDTAPAAGGYAPTATNPSINVFCNVFFANGDATLVVAVKDRNSGQYVTDAQVTAWMIGTDAKYPPAPATQFSGSGATMDSNHLPGVPTYRFTFPFSVPPVQYDAQGNQLPSAYSTYRCKASVTWQGQSAGF